MTKNHPKKNSSQEHLPKNVQPKKRPRFYCFFLHLQRNHPVFTPKVPNGEHQMQSRLDSPANELGVLWRQVLVQAHQVSVDRLLGKFPLKKKTRIRKLVILASDFPPENLRFLIKRCFKQRKKSRLLGFEFSPSEPRRCFMMLSCLGLSVSLT